MVSSIDIGEQLDAIHRRISAPISLFWGGADDYFPVARARTMFDTFVRRGELYVEPHAKLYVHEECPMQLASFSLPLLQAAFASTDEAHPALATSGARA